MVISLIQQEIQVEILSGVLMEAYFVSTKFYKIDKNEIIQDLKTIICFEGAINKILLKFFKRFYLHFL
ncbi:hypothetical protein [Campylobacter helveticus]|uniref:hypothetical protein n=1 Tax=Campylobacter helveticus TaxID=28898 RepID=UPI00209414D4|nr:hypothetical protein [Campylobacter helveticus]